MIETNNLLSQPSIEAKKLREKRLHRTMSVLAISASFIGGFAAIAPLYEKNVYDTVRVTPNGDPSDIMDRALSTFETKHPTINDNDIRDIASSEQQVGGDISKYKDVIGHTPESVSVEIIKDGYGNLTIQGEASNLPPNQDTYLQNQ